MEKIIEAKREEKPLPEMPEPQQPGRVLDLMAALEESVSTAKASRGEDADVHELQNPRKKTAAKKTTAKKQPAKKTTAKKAASRKPRRSVLIPRPHFHDALTPSSAAKGMLSA
ncbi:hypothetical protein ACIRPU_41905 [Streptomyces sp. NPDC102259]|uniref:hypothetical protein n=1 Tax=Streptomyces sp. NPDC102259 TaxID=3366148 RepID=UPI003820AEFD